MLTRGVNLSSGRIGLLLVGLIALVALGFPQGASAAYRVHAGLQIDVGDYDYLSDYGEWIEVPPFGMVWHPYVVEDWEPFFHGHWSYTNDGWAWVSYEPYGWLVYHYGFWYRNPRIGWFWLPGRIWSPARVEWYGFGDYCGWAPLPPPGYYWRDPWDRFDYNVWVVVDLHHFTDDNIGRHRIHEPFHREEFRRDIMRRAPNLRRVETFTGRQIAPVRISKERMDLRPESNRGPVRYVRPRPVERRKMVLPESEMNKVREHAPQVEREVLQPKKAAPQERQRPPERKPEEMQKKRVRRR